MSKKDISKNYLTIQGWMVQDLELKGNELLAYALIYGFSQDNETEFTGSVNYICTWLNCSKSTVLRTMHTLVKRGLIIKEIEMKNNLTFNHYKVNFNKINQNDIGGVKMKRGVSKRTRGGCQNETEGGVKMKPNNTINNKDNNITHFDNASVFTFTEFWEAYGKKKDKFKAEKIYNKLSEQDRGIIKKTIGAYIQSTPDVQYRKFPCTYLNSRSWQDEIEETPKHHTPQTYDEIGYGY